MCASINQAGTAYPCQKVEVMCTISHQSSWTEMNQAIRWSTCAVQSVSIYPSNVLSAAFALYPNGFFDFFIFFVTYLSIS
mmetsp:Transcript_7479/g.10938  ORF Transcript_7479/g.10938 Transcript_7479/m.10938 type:complete len:80 (+) Transcript_7479:466-705(+)